MYVYDQYDQHIIEDRVRQFRDQTRRFLAGELAGDEFLPLRLQNGLYIQPFRPDCCASPFPTVCCLPLSCASWRISPVVMTRATRM